MLSQYSSCFLLDRPPDFSVSLVSDESLLQCWSETSLWMLRFPKRISVLNKATNTETVCFMRDWSFSGAHVYQSVWRSQDKHTQLADRQKKGLTGSYCLLSNLLLYVCAYKLLLHLMDSTLYICVCARVCMLKALLKMRAFKLNLSML